MRCQPAGTNAVIAQVQSQLVEADTEHTQLILEIRKIYKNIMEILIEMIDIYT